MRKPNVLIPMAGLGSRFLKEGFTVPKQLINIRNKHLIDLSLACLELSNCNIIFVIRDDHAYNYRLNEILKQKFGDQIHVVILNRLTRGSVESCLYAREYIDNDEPLVIHTLDIEFYPRFDPHKLYDLDADGILLTFQSNSPNYSYARIEGDYVRETAEKKSISPNACVGIYGFKRGSDFCHYANEMIQNDIRTNNEFYIAPLYNLLINNKKKIISLPVEKMHVFGTPEEFSFYKKNVIKRLGEKPIALCADHSGFLAKEMMKKILADMNLAFIDFGTLIDRDCNYKDYIWQATKAIIEGECDFAFGFCRTGQGVNICANKCKGIRSALIYDRHAMEMSIRHNCANFFAIPTRLFDPQEMKEFISIALSNTFDGGRHQIRVQEIEC